MPIPFTRVPFKRVMFRVHWIAGLTAGVVLAVVGLSGGLIGFEEPLLHLLNPRLDVARDGREPISPEQWIAAARRAEPNRTPRSVSWQGDDAPVKVRMASGKDRGTDVVLDPYDGRVLGAARGTSFFEFAEKVHRNLAAGPWGKQIVGASTAIFILVVATGVYLRWPRRAGSLSAWLRLDFKLKGRGFLWHLHAVAGTWLLLFYLVASLTGLWWSYDFYRNWINTMAGVSGPLRRPATAAGDPAAPLVPVDAAWAAFRREVPDATQANLALSSAIDAPVELRYQTSASPHDRAWNTLKIEPVAGAIISRDPYADLPTGRRFVFAMFPLHSGSILGWPGRVVMATASLLLPLFAVTGIWLWLLRRRTEKQRRLRAAMAPEATRPIDRPVAAAAFDRSSSLAP